jgi:membrane fusion protein, multidrug efflux system
MVPQAKAEDSGGEVIMISRRSDKLALLGTLACLTLTSCSRWTVKASVAAPESVSVRAVEAVSQDVPLEIAAVGNVEAVNSVEVKSRVAGQIKRVAFTEGQSVDKGQLLFAIDLDALQHQAAEQRAELERDTAIEQQARAVVARDAASQKQSQAEADIASKLGALGVISQQRVNQLSTTSDTAQASLRSDQAAVEAATGTMKADQARLEQTRLQLSFTSVVAPMSGRAGAVMVKTGNMVRENDTTLVTLLQISPIYVTFGVPEQILPEVQRLNAQGSLIVEAGNGDGPLCDGRLAFIDNTVDATTGTIRLKAVFPNAKEALWPGEFVNVRVRLKIEHDRTIVPGTSVQDGLDGKYIWLVKSGVATIAPVTVLRTYKPENGPELAVLGGGIAPGQTVVTDGQLRLTPGVRVALLDTPRSQLSQLSSGSTKSAQ